MRPSGQLDIPAISTDNLPCKSTEQVLFAPANSKHVEVASFGAMHGIVEAKEAFSAVEKAIAGHRTIGRFSFVWQYTPPAVLNIRKSFDMLNDKAAHVPLLIP